jgi:hypothetical protein
MDSKARRVSGADAYVPMRLRSGSGWIRVLKAMRLSGARSTRMIGWGKLEVGVTEGI